MPPGNVQMSQSSGVEVLKCSELRCQGVKRRFRKPKHTKELINEDSYRYTWNLLKISETCELKAQLVL